VSVRIVAALVLALLFSACAEDGEGYTSPIGGRACAEANALRCVDEGGADLFGPIRDAGFDDRGRRPPPTDPRLDPSLRQGRLHCCEEAIWVVGKCLCGEAVRGGWYDCGGPGIDDGSLCHLSGPG